MTHYQILIPIIGTIGIFVIISIALIARSMEKRAQISSINAAKFNNLAEEIIRDNAEIKKSLQTVKEKVEAIDKMMKDI